ncbi:MAG TPA: ATP-binding protein [Roseiflexaceae bacterium]|nr:ATP-binding protein [Roseiflexaceae bacterium]
MITQNAKRKTQNFTFPRRVGFWRALVEMIVVANGVAMLTYPFALLFGSPWAELVTYPLLAVLVWPAWRLEAGRGPLWRRGLRLLAWLGLFSLLSGLVGWVLITLIPYPGRMLGMPAEVLRVPLPDYLLSDLLLTATLLLPARLLIALWSLGQQRLRWQLTFSYALIGVLTTVLIPVTLSLFIGINSLSAVPPLGVPEEQARAAADLVTPLVRRGAPPEELGPLLQSMLAGGARLPLPPGSNFDRTGPPVSFEYAERLTLLRPDGQVLASAGTPALDPGAPLPRDQRAALALPLERVRGGGCAAARPASGPGADQALCAIGGEDGATLAVLVIDQPLNPVLQWGLAVSRVISITLVGTNLLLVIGLVVVAIVMGLALGVGYLLARRLSLRLEELVAATGAVAAGTLDRPLPVDTRDEIGQLSAGFNRMAEQLRERQQALLAEKERAERLLAANRRLVADVSHELRTPVTTLRGYLEALELSHGDQLPAHDMGVIQAEIGRLTRMIDDLFTLARAEAQQLPLTIVPVDAAALVRRLIDTLAPLARRERQIEIVDALPATLPMVCADGARLEQVLLNLAQNALRHTPPGGIVAFEAETGDGLVTISVADTGAGISAEELPLVFERFYRGDPSRARETGGAGLGLALVRELVTAMGGSVSAESTLQRGSRFRVTLVVS